MHRKNESKTYEVYANDSLDAFINLPLNPILRTSRSSTCNRNRFDSLPVYHTSYAVRSAM